MNRREVLGTSTIMALGTMLPGGAHAQAKTLKEQLIGAWSLVSNDNTLPDGTKRQLYGPNPKGLLILDASGRWAQINERATRANFKSADRLQATPEEGKAVLNDVLAQFGTWSVDEASKTILVRIDGSLIPNTEGTDGKRIITSLSADELKYTNPAPGAGGMNEIVYRRVK